MHINHNPQNQATGQLGYKHLWCVYVLDLEYKHTSKMHPKYYDQSCNTEFWKYQSLWENCLKKRIAEEVKVADFQILQNTLVNQVYGLAVSYLLWLFKVCWLLHFLLQSFKWFLHDISKLSEISFQEDAHPELQCHHLLLARKLNRHHLYLWSILGCCEHVLLSPKDNNTIIHEVHHRLGKCCRWRHNLLWSYDSRERSSTALYVASQNMLRTCMEEVARVRAASLEDVWGNYPTIRGSITMLFCIWQLCRNEEKISVQPTGK